MKFAAFLEEKFSFIIFQIILIAIITGILYLTNIPIYYIILTIILLITLVIAYLFIVYIFNLRKYKKIVSLVDNLEEKFLLKMSVMEEKMRRLEEDALGTDSIKKEKTEPIEK